MSNSKMPSMLAVNSNGVKEIVGNDKSREKLCALEVNGVLSKYDCTLVPKLISTPGSIAGVVEVTAKPRVPGEGLPQ